jgi:hypothetical protein
VTYAAPPGLDDDIALITEVTTDSPVVATLFATESEVVQGNPAVLTAALFDGDRPAAGAEVVAFVKAGAGAPVQLTLRDDGGAGDGAAGDGLYSGQFNAGAPGHYEVLAKMTGTSASGARYARQGAAAFTVVAPTSDLTGALADQGVDSDGDGRFEQIALDIETRTTRGGEYRLLAQLKTAQGKQLVSSAAATLAPGERTVRVAFEAAAFVRLGENGPYDIELVELTFLGEQGPTPADRLVAAGQTRHYLLSQLQSGGDGPPPDTEAPVTSAARSAQPNAAGWNNTDVVVTLAAADNAGGSGVSRIVYSVAGAQAGDGSVAGASATLTLAAEGTTNVTFHAVDNAGNAEPPQTFTVRIDKTAPRITVNAPNGSYLLNQAVAVNFACDDGGSGVTACAGSAPSGSPVDTSSVGPRSFAVTAADAAGNTASAAVSYAVTYGVRLKYDAGKSHLSGSTIPVRIQLVDANGVNVSNAGLVAHALGTAMASAYAPGPVEDAGNANPDDDFRFANFDGEGGYIFNLKTTGFVTGTYVLIFRAGADPVTHGVEFQVK